MSDVSFADRLAFGRECDVTLAGLTTLGAAIYAGSRMLQLRNDNWQNKEPLPMGVLYLTVVPADI
ncbi:hypothetical protein [Rhizobium sp. WSM1325]|uniref:hypothetical protein n=1 Tax=Rhizobium sp. WSM1325 TaxID=3444086 RepID=UPI000FF34031|nr:hypothetical protein [Rhizobium leguminosarum]RWY75292.1 hypothetical protein EHI48_19135 [Rhizobium leguminosarum]